MQVSPALVAGKKTNIARLAEFKAKEYSVSLTRARKSQYVISLVSDDHSRPGFATLDRKI
jgi:hypothetical protein